VVSEETIDMRRVLVLLFAAGLVAGCSMPDDEPTYPLPTTAIIWPMPTVSDLGPVVCPSASLAPVKINWDATHRALNIGGQKVFWPAGFTARILPDGHLELVAPNGTVVARDGDTITLGGSDYSHICRVQGVEY
jgi:hypothetical protein